AVFLRRRRRPMSTLLPYTTLFRSRRASLLRLLQGVVLALVVVEGGAVVAGDGAAVNELLDDVAPLLLQHGVLERVELSVHAVERAADDHARALGAVEGDRRVEERAGLLGEHQWPRLALVELDVEAGLAILLPDPDADPGLVQARQQILREGDEACVVPHAPTATE